MNLFARCEISKSETLSVPRVINFVVNKYFHIFGRSMAGKRMRANAVKFYREFVYDGKTRSEEVEEHCKFAPGNQSRICKILITFFFFEVFDIHFPSVHQASFLRKQVRKKFVDITEMKSPKII